MRVYTYVIVYCLHVYVCDRVCMSMPAHVYTAVCKLTTQRFKRYAYTIIFQTNLYLQQVDEIAQARNNPRAQVAVELSFRCLAGAADDLTRTVAVVARDTRRHDAALARSQQGLSADRRQTGQRVVETAGDQQH